MKPIVICSLILLALLHSFAQTPQGIKYQAVARDNNGNILANQSLSIKTTVIDSALGGNAVFEEIHKIASNNYGLFSLILGEGTPVIGTLSTIQWSTGEKWLKIDMDPAGGQNYTFMGTAKLVSVPYALYAEQTGNVDDADADPTNELQTIAISGDTLILTNGNSIILPSGTVGTDDQNLSLTGTVLFIEDGNSVDLSVLQDGVTDADADPNNEIQSLNLSNDLLSISSGNSVNLTPYSDNTDAQTLTFNSGTGELAITGGNTITLPTTSGGDNWGSQVTQHNSTITGDGTNGSPLGVVGDLTDDQNLSLSGTQLSIDDGNSVDLSSLQDGVNDADADSTNEIQDISFSGTDLSISGGSTIDLSSLQDGVDDADNDSLNEIQDITLNGTDLSISSGSSVDLSGLQDDDDWVKDNLNVYRDTGYIGIGITNPLADIHLKNFANVLYGDSLTGSGFKLIWYGQKGALRFGYLSNPFGGYNYNRFWDYDSCGYYSFAGGQNSRAKGFGAFAWGSFGWADGSSSVAFFGNAKGNNSYTFGGSSKGRGSFTVEGTAEDEGGIAMYGYTGGRYGVAIGGGTTGLGASSAREDYGVAIGWNADARGQASIALGPADAWGYNSFATGWVTEAKGNYSSTFGYRTNSYAYASMALGRYNKILGDSSSWVSTDPIFQIGDGTSTSSRSDALTILKNGSVGIGISTPTSKVHITNGSDVALAGGGYVQLGSSTGLNIAIDDNEMMARDNGAAAILHFQNDGGYSYFGDNVGIGTTAPTAQLELSDPGFVSARITSVDNTDAAVDLIRIGSGNRDWRIINDNGNFRIQTALDIDNDVPTDEVLVGTSFSEFDGTVRPAADNVYDLGTSTLRWDDIYATSGTVNMSDARVKTDISELNYGLKEILALRPVSYHWIGRENEPKKLGLIAQELQEVLSEVVKTHDWQYSEDGSKKWTELERLGVYYSDIIPVLVKAIQEQQEMINEKSNVGTLNQLKAENEKLKARMTQLEQKLEELN